MVKLLNLIFIYDSIKNLNDDNQVYSIDAIDYFAPEFFELDRKNELNLIKKMN